MLQVLTDEQREKLLNAPDHRTRLGRRDRALLAVLLYGGLRIAEVCGLRQDNIIREEGRTRLVFSGKGSKTRTVTLPLRAVSLLEMHQTGNTTAFVFPGRVHSEKGACMKPLTTRAAYNIVIGAAQKAGLPAWVHPHSTRHSYATSLLRKTHDIELVQKVLGHSDIRTTAKYYIGHDPRAADRAAEVFDA